MQYRIKLNNVGKRFGKQVLFREINETIVAGSPMAITGHNGAGKSTLLQIIASVVSPTKGFIEYFRSDNQLYSDEFHNLLGFSSPVITPYDALSGRENINFALKKNIVFPDELIHYFKLDKHIDKSVSKYSSGMKQRLKLIIAMMNNFPFLLLDEPSSNLDDDGKSLLYKLIDNLRDEKLIIIATNEAQEVALCKGVINLD